jgi:hypothetical protein
LFCHLLKKFEEGGIFCGLAVEPARVLYLTEENEDLWIERRDALGLKDSLSVVNRQFPTKPRMPEWLAWIDDLAKRVILDHIDLVYLDTLSNHWPVRDENNAAEVQESLMPLHKLTATGAGMVALHHLSKGDGQEARGSRGSGALPAFVDTIIELRRFDPGNPGDRRRVLTGYGRSSKTPAELVVELLADGGGYTAKGNRDEVTKLEIQRIITSLLPVELPGITDDEIRENWPGPAPQNQKLLAELRAGVGHCWERQGQGKKGSPYTYWIRPGL